MGAGAAGTVYRVKHKTEGGEVFILFYTAVFVHFGICIFNVVFVCFSYLYTTRDIMWMEVGLGGDS